MAETDHTLAAELPQPRRLGWAWLTVGFLIAAGWGALLSYSLIYLSGDLPLRETPGRDVPMATEMPSLPQPADLARVVAAVPPPAIPAPAQPPETRESAPAPLSQAAPTSVTATAPTLAQGATGDAAGNGEATAETGATEPDFVGTWGPNRLACGLRAQRRGFIQAVITPERAKAGSTTCAFRNVRRSGIAWVMAAECNDGGQRWSSQVRLLVDEDRLTWTSGKGTANYVRCGRRTG